MTIDEILQNKELAYLKKKNEIHKSDFSNFSLDETNKALPSDVLNASIEVLIYETNISRKRNEVMFEQYKNGYVLNHSVGMRYMKLFLCYNNDTPEYSTEKENWNKYFPQVLNKKDVEAKGYFWAVTEAKNVEGSAVVKGSNFLTPSLEVKEIDEDTINVKLAISPCGIVDSHSDLHVKGLWKKTISENPYDLLLQEHDMDFDKVIADSINDGLKVYTEEITVKELLSKFKKKNIEPSNDTQNKGESAEKPHPLTPQPIKSYLLI